MADAVKKLSVRLAVEGASEAQSRLQAFAKAAQEMGKSIEDVGKSAKRGEDIEAYGKALDDLRAKYNPVFAAQRDYLKSVDDIKAAHKVGAISAGEMEAALSRTKAGFSERMGSFKTGLDNTGKAANENASRVVRFGEAFDTAEGKIKGTLRSVNDVRGAIDLVAPGASAATEGIGDLANTIGNLSDVAGTLASVFLRNPLGLVALGLSAAVVGYLSLSDNIDKSTVAEESYQKAVAATGPLLETQIQQTRRLADERSDAASKAVELAIADQEAALAAARRAQAALEADKKRIVDERGGLPGFDADRVLVDPLARASDAIAKADANLADLQRRLRLVSPDGLDLGRSLEAVRAELEGFGAAKPTALEALNADFARVKATLDAGLAEGLRLTREEYDALLATAGKRRDLGIAAVLEDEAIRVQAASNALFASLQEVIDREQAATNARQRSGADIEARIDAYYREADATRAGADALAEFRREQEEGRVRAEAFSQALQAYPDDLEAIQGAVDRTVEAWRRLKEAQAAVPAVKTDTDKLRESIDGLGAGFERAGRRSSRALADMLFGLDKARFSVQNFLAQIGSDIAEGLIRKRITDPITSGLSGIFDSLFADGAAFDRGRVTAFARGGIVDKPTLFPMENGAGLMGEAGPEAVMPLKRLGDGKLGVRAEIETRAAPAAGVTVNVYDNRTSRDSSSVAVSERRGGDGSRQIDVLIEDKVAAAVVGGRFDTEMNSRYGARQTVKRT